MANELSPMAAESYALNFFNEDLQEQSDKQRPCPKKTLWLSSQYSIEELKLRLRENPGMFPPLAKGFNDLKEDGSNLKGSLVVGSIVDLNVWLQNHPAVSKKIKSAFGRGGLDLVSGGPPCQSFSMAGLRKQDCEKNSLPWEFASFVKVAQPKFVLLENVTGILRPFTDEFGNSYYAWFEVAKAFSEVGYVPLCLHVNAKYVGIPQNRPRFILMGVREDFFNILKPTFNQVEEELFQQSWDFFCKAKNGDELPLDTLEVKDVMRSNHLRFFTGSFLSPLATNLEKWLTVEDAIDDLRDDKNFYSEYRLKLNRIFGRDLAKRELKNHDLRENSPQVKRRFRIYQVLQGVPNETRKRVLAIIKGDTHVLDDEDWKHVSRFEYLLESGGFSKFRSKIDYVDFLLRHGTKKHSQKALERNQPAPAALSIPDDVCHYAKSQLRTLTVRELARIQSFPDAFEFRSKVTTGSHMRKYEVPQYTQVSNAVPPLLGRALGSAICKLMDRVDTKKL